MFHSMFMSKPASSYDSSKSDLDALELEWEAEVAAVNAGYDSPVLAAYNLAPLDVADCYAG